ncbi:aminoglycoside adenylyltransferase domain-containing protein [Arsenicicoccus sp. oral taxon 190]|uniref:aminoglycoside adenylyltransferase domain-containing protein n=1 Tax=Arsenicicoccus sp. oral taxon 190 TaxID=1658671 RepID=UPI00067A0A9C|nr:aminoglycoside adenylyltransferase domain-containing protein [Arsenicicoccus sp. oral taxon 190]AKT52311.1 hypothetical protein ADJ73_15380 [Arsenicicoccus sp. oral taxon 190]
MTTPWQPLADHITGTLTSALGGAGGAAGGNEGGAGGGAGGGGAGGGGAGGGGAGGGGLVGVYLHGSAALGGWVPGRSDLDLLVVVSDDLQDDLQADHDWRELARTCVTDLGADESRIPVELSMIRRSLAESPRAPWPFVVHATTRTARQQDPLVVLDDGAGDPDLALHLAVTRAAGVALHGPAPAELVGEVDRDDVLAQLSAELSWGVDNADEAYAVLNACRALRYAETGELVSKVAGGEWALQQRPEHDVVVRRALDAQRRGIRLEGAGMAGRALVQDVLDDLTWA